MTFAVLSTPPSQEEILARWRPDRGHQVSICMLAYNHAPYIRDAIHAVLNQKTDFGFELLIHDDASQDGTGEIIREYAERYPFIIKPILQKVNQYSQGIPPSVRYNYPRANLPFVAICEGDDHWTDENKLQIQIDGLLARPDINLSFHSAHWINYEDPDVEDLLYGDYARADTVLSFQEVIHRVRGWIPFASCVIRQCAKEQFLEFLINHPYLTIGEIYLQFFGALPRGALFFARPMSLYRYKTQHSWTRKASNDRAFKAKHELAMIRSYVDLNVLTGKTYHDEFVALMLTRLLWLFSPLSPPETLRGVQILLPLHTDCQAVTEATLKVLSERNSRYVIYGCASGCKRVQQNLTPEKITAIIDRDKRYLGKLMEGKPVISPEDLAQHADCEVVVSTIASDRHTIEAQTKAAGIPPDRVHYLFDSALRLVAVADIPPEITNS